MLPLRGLHVNHAVQRGIWVPTQHFLWDEGKPWSNWPVAGPSGCKLISSQQSDIKYVSLCAVTLLKNIYKLFLQIFFCAFNLDKHQTSAEGMNAYMHKHAYNSLIITPCASKSCYVSQYVLVSSPLWNLWPDIIFCLKVAVLSMWGALSDERLGLSLVSHCQQCLVHCQNFIVFTFYMIHTFMHI
jgi:hypothetical protein